MTTATLAPATRKVPELNELYARREEQNPRLRKEYDDFRDRAAYVYVTGTFPTHLRTFFTGLLRMATRYNPAATALDKRTGHIATRPEVVAELQLNDHPMVKKVMEYVADEWKIQTSRSVTDRRPYTKVFMFKEAVGAGVGRGIRKVTVQVDGSVKEGWE